MQTAPSTAHPWLDGLNDPQREAVQTLSGPLSCPVPVRKTRVLTSRLAELVATGTAKPWNILAVTFTNKAAREMKMRVASMVGPMAEQVWLVISRCRAHTAPPRRSCRASRRLHHP